MLPPASLARAREEVPNGVGVHHRVAVRADEDGADWTGARAAVRTSEPAVTAVRNGATRDFDAGRTAGVTHAGRVPGALRRRRGSSASSASVLSGNERERGRLKRIW